jgi:hypothetical protein
MITLHLDEPDAIQMHSDMLLKAAQFTTEAQRRVALDQHEAARICGQLAERWSRLASAVQTAVILQRGLKDKSGREG